MRWFANRSTYSTRSERRALVQPRARRLFLESLEDRRLLAIGVDDSMSVHVGGSGGGDPTGNDTLRSWTTQDGQTHDPIASFDSGPSHGSLSSGEGPGLPFIYTPDPGYIGSDSFSYSIYDEPGGWCEQTEEDGSCSGDYWHANEDDGTYGWSGATVNIDVNNAAPTVSGGSFTTDEDQPLDSSVSASDPDGDPITLSVTSGPSNGGVSLNDDGTFTYTPNAGYSGDDSFTFHAYDTYDYSDDATVTITVTPPPAPPTANDDTLSTGTDSPASGNVLGNDSYATSASLDGGASHGSVDFSDDGSFTYTPDPGFRGYDGFSYTAINAVGTAGAGVTILVDNGPTAGDGTAGTDEDTSCTIWPIDSASDPDGDDLSVSILSGPSNGSLSVNPDGSVTYTPAQDYNGSDSFSYQVSDGWLSSDPANVTITIAAVDDAPSANDDSYIVDPVADGTLQVPAPGVLGNDTDVDSPSLEAQLVSGPSHGTLTLNSDGSFTYTPDADFHGIDSFVYIATDGDRSGQATTCVISNQAPTPQNDPYSTDEDTPLVIGAPGLLLNDTDPENDPLFASFLHINHGSVSLAADGGFTYTPSANFSGPDYLTYQSCDDYHCTTATATITVNPINDAPVLSGSANFSSINEDNALSFGNLISTLLSGHVTDADTSDPRGIALTALDSSTGAWEYSTDGGNNWLGVGTVSSSSALLLLSTDRLRFVPDRHNGTTASVIFRAWDQTSGDPRTNVDVTTSGGATAFSAATATASIIVTSVNDAPVLTGANDLASITEDDTANTGNLVSSLISGFVTDVDTGALSGIAITSTASGNGTWQYQLSGTNTWTGVGAVVDTNALLLRSNDRLRLLPDTLNGTTASATFRAWDQATGTAGTKANASLSGGSTAFSNSAATAHITVTAVNDAPIAPNDGPYAFDSSLQSTFSLDAANGVLSNDTDIDLGDTLSAVLVAQPTHGTVALNPDGSFSYTPAHSFAGTDSFTYRAIDGASSSNTATSNLATVTFNVSNTRDVALTSFTADGTYLDLSYFVIGGDVNPFYIGLYASPDGVTRGHRIEALTADDSSGSHSLSFIPYFEDLPANYYLLAMVDSDDSINETHETNNAAALIGGAYLARDSVSGQKILEIEQNETSQAVDLSLIDGQLTLETRDLTDISHIITDDDTDLGFLDVTGDTNADTEKPGVVSLLDAQAIAFDRVHTDRLWQNPTNRWDVNGDGFVAPNDVIAVENILSPNGGPALLNQPRGAPTFLYGTDSFLDVSGDNVVSEIDALEVADKINNHSGTLTLPHQNPDNPLDVTNDGVVNSDDEQVVLRYLANQARSQGAPTVFSTTYDNTVFSTIGQLTVRQHYRENILVTDDGLIDMSTPQIDVYTPDEDPPHSDDGIPYWLVEYYNAGTGQSPFPTWWYDGIGAPSNGDLDYWLPGIREMRDPPPYTLLNGTVPDWLLDVHKALYGIQAFPDWWYSGVGAPSAADLGEFAYGLKPAFMGGASDPTTGPCSVPGSGITLQDPSNPDQDVTGNSGKCAPTDPPTDVIANNDGEPDMTGDFTYWTFDSEELDVSAGDGVLKNDKNASDATGPLEAHICTTGILGCQQAQHGTVSLNINGSFTFIPASGFSGLASFMYYAQAQDGRKSDPVKVTIAVDELAILLGPAPGAIDITNQRADFWAGDLVGLNVGVRGPQSVADDAITEPQWTILGDAINGYQQTQALGKVLQLTDAVKAQRHVDVHWISAGINEITVSVKVNGDQIYATAQTEIHKPSGTITADQGIVELFNVDGLPPNNQTHTFVSLGDAFSATEVKGIEFTRSPSEVPGATTFFRQIIVRDWHGDTADGRGIWFAQNNVTALDSGKLRIDDAMLKFHDDPYVDLTLFSEPFRAVHAYGHADFETYVMWQSSVPGSIPVPLQKLTWSWSYEVTDMNPGGQPDWLATTPAVDPGEPSFPQSLAGADCTALPEWDANSNDDQKLYGD
jgi:hypothetical protein